jgi:hypothetical protein
MCGFTAMCDNVKDYCLFGAPSTCTPLPAECTTCQETHDCACLLPHVPKCDGGAPPCQLKTGGQLTILPCP